MSAQADLPLSPAAAAEAGTPVPAAAASAAAAPATPKPADPFDGIDEDRRRAIYDHVRASVRGEDEEASKFAADAEKAVAERERASAEAAAREALLTHGAQEHGRATADALARAGIARPPPGEESGADAGEPIDPRIAAKLARVEEIDGLRDLVEKAARVALDADARQRAAELRDNRRALASDALRTPVGKDLSEEEVGERIVLLRARTGREPSREDLLADLGRVHARNSAREGARWERTRQTQAAAATSAAVPGGGSAGGPATPDFGKMTDEEFEAYKAGVAGTA